VGSGMGPGAVGARPTASAEDLLLSGQLAAFFILWLREWPPAGGARWRSRVLFAAYGVALGGGAAWCLVGAYVHAFEPLPTEQTPAWLAFLLLGAITPILFPVALAAALEGRTLPQGVVGVHLALAALQACGYAAAAVSGVDLSLGGQLPDEVWLSPWHRVDGRSYGGAALGVPFDLVSTMPCYRGDSLCVLAAMFLASCFYSTALLWYGSYGPASQAQAAAAARWLCLAVGAMGLNCLALLLLVTQTSWSLAHVFHVFHLGQGAAMAVGFWKLRGIMRLPAHGKEA